MNHLEQLVSEWLQYKGYFVRTAIHVGSRSLGGYEGELDVVAYRPKDRHFLHVECSLDARKGTQREDQFRKKFQTGANYARDALHGLEVAEPLDQVALLQFAGTNIREIGGGRVVLVRELIHEMMDGLKGTSPAKKAVPSNLPLLRTVQLVDDSVKTGCLSERRLVPTGVADTPP